MSEFTVHSPHAHAFTVAGLSSLSEDLDRPIIQLPLFAKGLAEGVSGLRALIGQSLMSVILWRLDNFCSEWSRNVFITHSFAR